VELVPSQASPERNFRQSSPSAFGGSHLFGKCGTRAYAIRDAEAVTLLCATALKEGETATSRSQTRRLDKKCSLSNSLYNYPKPNAVSAPDPSCSHRLF
jgi:hypothetical protein